MLRQKTASLLRILSLGFGVASSVILFFIGINELTTDAFYGNKDNMYELFLDFKSPNYSGTSNTLTQKIIPALVNDFPQVENGTVVYNNQKTLYLVGNHVYELNTLYADSGFFKVFNRNFIAKSLNNNLAVLNSAVITKKLAIKLFGTANASIGKRLLLNSDRAIIITGVIEDWPSNSSFKSDIIISFNTLEDENRLYMGWGGGDSFQGYVVFREDADVKSIEKQIPDFIQKYYDFKSEESKGFYTNYYFVPIEDVNTVADPQYKQLLYLFFLIGVLIFILVCFNSLMIVLSVQSRFKREIYIQRALGASFKDIGNFVLQDSILHIILSVIVAVGFIAIVDPFVKKLYSLSLLSSFTNISFIGIFILLFFIAFLFHYFAPMRWTFRFFYLNNQNERNTIIKRYSNSILLSFQIAVSVFLFIFMYVIYSQFNFIKSFDKGYNSSNLVYVELRNKELYSKDKLIKQEITKLPNVLSAGLSDNLPIWGLSGNGFYRDSQQKELKILRNIYVDKDFFSCLGIEIEGNSFTQNDEKSVIISKGAANIFGINNDVVGKTIFRSYELKIKAVCSDIVSYSLHSKIEPVVFSFYDEPSPYSCLTIRLNNKNILQTVNDIKAKIADLVPNQIVQVKFYDEQIRQNYEFDRAIQTTINFFALLAAIITLAGIIGFAMRMIEYRTKELAIRKVNGASAISLLFLLSKSFLWSTITALFVAIPVSFYVSKLYLQNYAYSIELSLVIFVVAGLLSVIFILLIVSIFTMRMVRENPVKTLRYE